MTDEWRAEVMAMSDKELRIKVAELRGDSIHVFDDDDPIRKKWPHIDACLVRSRETIKDLMNEWDYAGVHGRALKEGVEYLGVGARTERWELYPDHPNDIAAAMDLWESLPRNRQLYDLDGMIYCSFGGNDDGCLGEGEGDTPARAITRAFVYAMGGDDEQKQ